MGGVIHLRRWWLDSVVEGLRMRPSRRRVPISFFFFCLPPAAAVVGMVVRVASVRVLHVTF
jgi:hypothetical protein